MHTMYVKDRIAKGNFLNKLTKWHQRFDLILFILYMSNIKLGFSLK